MQKHARQDLILKLIETNAVSRQEQIVALLAERGHIVTQASVSRDLVDLGIVKVKGNYASPRKTSMSGFGIVDLAVAGENLIVARCQSGLASAIAVKIDSAKIKEIVGTIAGDDTIMIAVENGPMQRLAIKKLWDVLSK